MRLLAVCSSLFVSVLVSSQCFGREWLDATGKYKINAELVIIRGDKVILEKKEGGLLSVPIAKLCPADQKFLREKSSSAASPKANSTPMDEPKKIEPSSSDNDSDTTSKATQIDPAEANNDGVDPETNLLATQAHEILSSNCLRCHGQAGADEGGFNFATDRERLVASGYVLPKDAGRSPLMERLLSKDSPMPPAGESPRPSQAELATLHQWIQAGAPAINKPITNPFITTEQVIADVAVDLRSLSKADRDYARYFSITHLANAGTSAEELATYRQALAKLLNSLSWNRQLAPLHQVNDQPHLFRIDLRDLKWPVKTWEQILAKYPYGLLHESLPAYRLQKEIGTEIPVVRADWFIAAASRPPLYHELAQIPTSDTQLETLLQINLKRNLDQGRALRVGFARSGVSQNNRLIERHGSIFGAYWKSYDFSENTGRRNVFENPVGPGALAGMFRHDGGEIIFHLPNGLLAFMLTDATGKRIDRGPIEIVSDPRQRDRTVVNGVSCMSCHHSGLIPKSDEIRRHVQVNSSAYAGVDHILDLYPESSVVDKHFVDDSKLYLDALARDEIAIRKPTQASEPIVLIANRYENELDLNLAAAELGLQPQEFKESLRKIEDREIRRSIGVLGTRGGVVKRQIFDQIFLQLATSLQLGLRPTTASTQTLADGINNNRGGQNNSFSLSQADEALQAALKAMKNEQWQLADDQFTKAINLSNDKLFTARIYEHAIPLYERSESIMRLIEAHKSILDLCQNTASIKQARAKFYHSMQRFGTKSSFWSSGGAASPEITALLNLPTSVASAIETTFERQLAQTPDHEPSLRIMETFWKFVQVDNSRKQAILLTLYNIYQGRGEQLEVFELSELAGSMVNDNDATKVLLAANIYTELADKYDSRMSNRPTYRLQAANAWHQAGNNPKAVSETDIAFRSIGKNREVGFEYTLQEVANLYWELGEWDQVKKIYGTLIRESKQSYSVAQYQSKLSQAIAMEADPPSDKPQSVQPQDDLLDSSRVVRMEAEQQEKTARENNDSAHTYWMRAAEKWLEIDEQKRAIAALKRAHLIVKRGIGSISDYVYTDLAELLRKVGMLQESLDLYTIVIQKAEYENTIEENQNIILKLLDEDASLKVSGDLKIMLDPNYKYIATARIHESEKSTNAESLAKNMVEAAEAWSKAGATEDVKRVGAIAQNAIKRINSTRDSYVPEVHIYIDLAEVYEKVGLHELAIQAYVEAMRYTGSDDDAEKYHNLIKVSCDRNGLAMPTIPPEAAIKLDPLHRYRVEALKKEAEAQTETNASSASSDFKDAAENWLKAGEKDHALRNIDLHAKYLLRKERPYDWDFTELADFYVSLDQPQRAIAAYEKALTMQTNDRSKARIQKKIDALK